jgi:hypothetical protein
LVAVASAFARFAAEQFDLSLPVAGDHGTMIW